MNNKEKLISLLILADPNPYTCESESGSCELTTCTILDGIVTCVQSMDGLTTSLCFLAKSAMRNAWSIVWNGSGSQRR